MFVGSVFVKLIIQRRRVHNCASGSSGVRSTRFTLTFRHQTSETVEFAVDAIPCRIAVMGKRSGDTSRLAQTRTPELMTEQRVSYTMDSTLETVDNAEQAASRFAVDTGFDEDTVMQISMAVREAAVNAVLHGNAYDPGKKVKVEFERTKGDLVITIRDQGKGLDLGKIPDPLAPENLLKTSGRGIFLIRSFMDEVEFNPSATGTEIKLVKHVRGPAAERKEASQ
jgi:serine/threonine-protein kinase RsbW